MDIGAAGIDSVINNSMNVAGGAKLLEKQAGLANAKDVDKAAKEFEAVFITQMIQQMYEGVEVNKDFGGGHAEKIFRSMMFDEYGKVMANAGGIGVAQQVKNELIKIQEMGR